MAESLRISYTAVTDARGETTLRPLLQLTLLYNNPSVEVVGLLDSGADVNVLPYQVGVRLGILWDEHPTLSQLSGNLGHYEARGVVLTGRIGSFAPVRLGFAWTRAENVPLILGQANFFAEFSICFYRSEGAFVVSSKSHE